MQIQGANNLVETAMDLCYYEVQSLWTYVRCSHEEEVNLHSHSSVPRVGDLNFSRQ